MKKLIQKYKEWRYKKNFKLVNKSITNLKKKISNPPEDIQLYAMRKNTLSYFFIKNPTEKVQIEAVTDNASLLQIIKNPSEKVQLAAVKKDGFVIHCIDNPCGKVQFEAIKQNSRAIEFIENPSEELQLLALENEWERDFYENFIKDLPNKTEWFYREFNRLKLIKGPLK